MPKPFENPLLPNRRLREMYLAMLQVRLLGKALGRRRLREGLGPSGIPPGQEACWTATAIGLRDQPGDLVSDSGAGSVLNAILDARAGTRLKLLLSGKAVLNPELGPVRLPPAGKASERLHYALGAAMALASQNRKSVLLAYLSQGDLTKAEWKPIFAAALAMELPIVFIVLPQAGARFDTAQWAQACGIPGIAVEAPDAVAIYRVAQESIGRARAGGGASLIACVPFPAVRTVAPDPLDLLAGQLLRRKLCTPRWLTVENEKFQARIAAARLP